VSFSPRKRGWSLRSTYDQADEVVRSIQVVRVVRVVRLMRDGRMWTVNEVDTAVAEISSSTRGYELDLDSVSFRPSQLLEANPE
jgi:hypothetical protein